MRSFLSILTAVMLLVHTLLGCCTHHGHAAEEHEGCDHHAVAESHLSAFESADSDTGHDDCHDDEHSAPRDCEADARCQFVTSAAGTSSVMVASLFVAWETLLPTGQTFATKRADYRADHPDVGDCSAEDLALGVLRI